MQTNKFAFTSAEAIYPAFVSLNERDGFMVLTVRGPRKDNGDCGETVDVPVPRAELMRLYEALRDELTPPMMRAMGQSI